MGMIRPWTYKRLKKEAKLRVINNGGIILEPKGKQNEAQRDTPLNETLSAILNVIENKLQLSKEALEKLSEKLQKDIETKDYKAIANFVIEKEIDQEGKREIISALSKGLDAENQKVIQDSFQMEQEKVAKVYESEDNINKLIETFNAELKLKLGDDAYNVFKKDEEEKGDESVLLRLEKSIELECQLRAKQIALGNEKNVDWRRKEYDYIINLTQFVRKHVTALKEYDAKRELQNKEFERENNDNPKSSDDKKNEINNKMNLYNDYNDSVITMTGSIVGLLLNSKEGIKIENFHLSEDVVQAFENEADQNKRKEMLQVAFADIIMKGEDEPYNNLMGAIKDSLLNTFKRSKLQRDAISLTCFLLNAEMGIARNLRSKFREDVLKIIDNENWSDKQKTEIQDETKNLLKEDEMPFNKEEQRKSEENETESKSEQNQEDEKQTEKQVTQLIDIDSISADQLKEIVKGLKKGKPSLGSFAGKFTEKALRGIGFMPPLPKTKHIDRYLKKQRKNLIEQERLDALKEEIDQYKLSEEELELAKVLNQLKEDQALSEEDRNKEIAKVLQDYIKEHNSTENESSLLEEAFNAYDEGNEELFNKLMEQFEQLAKGPEQEKIITEENAAKEEEDIEKTKEATENDAKQEEAKTSSKPELKFEESKLFEIVGTMERTWNSDISREIQLEEYAEVENKETGTTKSYSLDDVYNLLDVDNCHIKTDYGKTELGKQEYAYKLNALSVIHQYERLYREEKEGNITLSEQEKDAIEQQRKAFATELVKNLDQENGLPNYEAKIPVLQLSLSEGDIIYAFDVNENLEYIQKAIENEEKNPTFDGKTRIRDFILSKASELKQQDKKIQDKFREVQVKEEQKNQENIMQEAEDLGNITYGDNATPMDYDL